MPKDYWAFVTNGLQVILSTVNDFCRAAPDFSTVEERFKRMTVDSRLRGDDGTGLGVKIGIKKGFLSRNGGVSRPLSPFFRGFSTISIVKSVE